MRLATLAVLGLSLAASRAESAVVVVTYTGTANITYDVCLFGPCSIGTNQPFALEFTVDTATPGLIPFADLFREQITGTGASNPIINSRFETLGRTFAWGNSTGDGYDLSAGEAFHQNQIGLFGGGNFDKIRHSSSDSGFYSGVSDSASIEINGGSANNILNTTSVSAPLVYDLRAGDTSQGNFLSRRLGSRVFEASLSASRITIVALDGPPPPPPLPGVPEPTTWAMLIAGFGLVGAALRRPFSRRPGRAKAI